MNATRYWKICYGSLSYVTPIENTTKVAAAAAGSAASVAFMAASALSGSPSLVMMLLTSVIAQDALKNLKLVNITFSENCDNYFNQIDNDLFPNYFADFMSEDDASYSPTYGKFAQWYDTAFFMDKYGSDLFTICVYSAAMGVLFLLRFPMSKCPKSIYKIYTRNILAMFMYNMPLGWFIGAVQSLFLGFWVQLNEGTPDSSFGKFSLIIGGILFELYIIALIASFFILRKVWRTKKMKRAMSNREKREFREFCERWGCLFEGLNDEKPLQFFFLYFLVLEGVCFAVTVFFLQSAPITCAIVAVAQGVAFLLLLMVVKPFEDFLMTLFMVFNKLCFISVSSIVLVLDLEELGSENTLGQSLAQKERHEALSSGIVTVLSASLYGSLGFSFISMVLSIFFGLRARFCPTKEDIEAKRKRLYEKLDEKEFDVLAGLITNLFQFKYRRLPKNFFISKDSKTELKWTDLLTQKSDSELQLESLSVLNPRGWKPSIEFARWILRKQQKKDEEEKRQNMKQQIVPEKKIAKFDSSPSYNMSVLRDFEKIEPVESNSY